jgi:hypothetical protein
MNSYPPSDEEEEDLPSSTVIHPPVTEADVTEHRLNRAWCRYQSMIALMEYRVLESFDVVAKESPLIKQAIAHTKEFIQGHLKAMTKQVMTEHIRFIRVPNIDKIFEEEQFLAEQWTSKHAEAYKDMVDMHF